ncbi:response regulator transcription factor [Alicyclobacillus acidiphilus]|uniref:response regulator transcription factor n=1 Tax=Alicyclobacillus acidiphilus TaxID=182455 RepID=UPI00082CAE8C|nr:LuxR C-terminal-related transcriptional regulator [Alicyclobacillus acidiphilus]
MPDDDAERASQGPSQKVQLILQFVVENESESIKKEIIVDISPTIEEQMQDQNPFRIINTLTAAVLKVFSATSSSDEASVSEPVVHEPKKVDSSMAFTPRELEVLHYLLTGATNQEIAQSMGISSNTVKFHIKNVFRKLHVKNRVELVGKFTH